MRISNIRQFLGGADNVIAREVIQGDRLGFRFDLGENSLENYTYDVDTELLRANVGSRGSNVTFNSLKKPSQTEETITVNGESVVLPGVPLDGTFNGNPNTTGKATYSNMVSNASDNMSATLTIPETLLSDLTTANAPVDTTNPFVVAMSVSLRSPASGGNSTKQSFRMLWIVRYRPIVGSLTI